MGGPALTGGIRRTAAVTLGLAPIRGGTAARVLEIHASVTRVPAIHVTVVIHASAAARGPRAGPAWTQG